MVAVPPPEMDRAAKMKANRARSMHSGAAEAAASLVQVAGKESKTVRPEERKKQEAAAQREREEVSRAPPAAPPAAAAAAAALVCFAPAVFINSTALECFPP